jgi:hypothetical protein
MTDLIVTSYFTAKSDRGKALAPRNDISYISPWYHSVKSLRLNGLILHDGLSDDFIATYSTDLISFEYHDARKWSPNDERYIGLLKELEKTEHARILMTDGNDVTVNKNPFEFMTENQLYCGTDMPRVHRLRDNGSCLQKWQTLKPLLGVSDEESEQFLEFDHVAVGICGGPKTLMLELFTLVSMEMHRINDDRNHNFMLINWLLWKYQFPFWKGAPFTSPLFTFDKSGNYYLTHK